MPIKLNKYGIKDLEKLNSADKEVQPIDVDYCLHQSCSQCHGAGRKADGQICFHYLVCMCKGCKIVYC